MVLVPSQFINVPKVCFGKESRFPQLRKRVSTALAVWLLMVVALVSCNHPGEPSIHFVVSIDNPNSHTYAVELRCGSWNEDTVLLRMPQWMPGYYQLMGYHKWVQDVWASDGKGKELVVHRRSDNTWALSGVKGKPFRVNYTISTDKQFVANSYVDSSRAYIVPSNTFMYVDQLIDSPVRVTLLFGKRWGRIATGLNPVKGTTNEFTAPDFDILYDCPILIGNLQELPPFRVKGIEHRFLAYGIGQFDRNLLMDNLKRVVEAAVAIFGEIPYDQYTFIGIGPGRGGIEHLNSTAISFEGSELNDPQGMSRTLNFIAHEYFHHYNVKRIRPFELGPFDYGRENRTNLLWVSEGLTVYYEYLIVKRAGLADGNQLLANLEHNINATERNPGRHFQSLQQASYNTWSDGPFGVPGKTISVYDKGTVLGLLLDLEIRHYTQNRRSLDDVMRLLYHRYYKKLKRGFTDAEFQAACEEVAGVPLTGTFEYVYTTREIDYPKYLSYAGLTLEKQTPPWLGNTTILKLSIIPATHRTPLQQAILKSWMGEG